MLISRFIRPAWDKLRSMHSASRAAAREKEAAREMAQKQILMQQLAATLQAGRGRLPK